MKFVFIWDFDETLTLSSTQLDAKSGPELTKQERLAKLRNPERVAAIMKKVCDLGGTNAIVSQNPSKGVLHFASYAAALVDDPVLEDANQDSIKQDTIISAVCNSETITMSSYQVVKSDGSPQPIISMIVSMPTAFRVYDKTLFPADAINQTRTKAPALLMVCSKLNILVSAQYNTVIDDFAPVLRHAGLIGIKNPIQVEKTDDSYLTKLETILSLCEKEVEQKRESVQAPVSSSTAVIMASPVGTDGSVAEMKSKDIEGNAATAQSISLSIAKTFIGEGNSNRTDPAASSGVSAGGDNVAPPRGCCIVS